MKMTAQDLANPGAAEVNPEAVEARKKAGTQVAAKKGKTTWKFFPEDVCVAGVDYPPDEKDPFYDSRTSLAIDADLVDDIDRNGVVNPPNVVRDGEVVKVNDGRRRILHARAANKLRIARGEPVRQVEVFLSTGDAKQIFLAARRSNAYRYDDDVLVRADNARRAITHFGATVEEVAGAEKVKPATVKEWLAVLELSVAARDSIKSGHISPTAALTLLRDVPRKDQSDVLAAEIAKGGGKVNTREAEAGAKNERKKREPALPGAGSPEPATPAPTKGVLKKLVRAYEKDPAGFTKKLFDGDAAKVEGFIRALRYALGDVAPRSIAGLTGALRELGVSL